MRKIFTKEEINDAFRANKTELQYESGRTNQIDNQTLERAKPNISLTKQEAITIIFWLDKSKI